MSRSDHDSETKLATLDKVTDDAACILDLDAGRQIEHLRIHLTDLCQSQTMFDSYREIRRPAMVRNHLNRIKRWAVRCKDRPEKADQLRAAVTRNCQQCGNAHGLLLWQCGLCVDSGHTEWAVQNGRAQKYLEHVSSEPGSLIRLVDLALASLGAPEKGRRGGIRHREDWTLRQNVLLLGVLYKELTGDKPSISVGAISGQPTGKFLAFLRICLRWLGWNLTDIAIRERFRTVRSEEGW